MQGLSDLNMKHAQFQIRLEEADASQNGSDKILFELATSSGMAFGELHKTASGGELSRFMLSAKSAITDNYSCLIFDEIDSGVAGDVALKMGNILQALSTEHQVVAITHSPQVAAKADAHYFVYKKHLPERTVTHVRLLTKDEKIRSIATMLSQNPPTQAAIQNAKELLGLRKVDYKSANQELSF